MADQQPTLQTPSGKKKLKSSTVKDEISQKGVTITGDKPDQININPMQEEVERHAVVVPGRFQPPTAGGHEMMIRKAEAHADSIGAETHVVASHSEGTSKNPIPLNDKTKYLKKIAKKGTIVSSYSKEHPSIYHYLSHLHKQGVKHVTIMAGEDRVKEYENVKKYNGKKGAHGIFDFKSIKVVSAGHRDPDAEGSEGISGTKIRDLARKEGGKGIKPHLPKAIQQHADEIANHINSIKEEILDLDDAFDFFYFAESMNDENPDPKHREAVSRSGQDPKLKQFVPRDNRDRKNDDRPYRHQEIVKKILDEKYGKGYVSAASKIEKAMKQKGIDINSDKHKQENDRLNREYQAILDKEKKEVKEDTTTSDIPVWEKPGPKGKSKKMTPGQVLRAKARAKRAGRPYPNLIDNMAVSKDK